MITESAVSFMTTNIEWKWFADFRDLSNNSLTGSVPEFLTQLKYLRVL